MTARIASAAVLLALLAGCASFRPLQVDYFLDDDGNVMEVEYGESSKPYTYKMVSPMNGAEVECTETKLVRIKLPEPSTETLLCYICQNESPKGTMYATRDGKWKFLTIGIASRLYLWYPDEREYLLVFEGNISPSAGEDGGRR